MVRGAQEQFWLLLSAALCITVACILLLQYAVTASEEANCRALQATAKERDYLFVSARQRAACDSLQIPIVTREATTTPYAK